MADTGTRADASSDTPAGLDAAGAGRGVRGPLGELDMAQLRHPSEPSRFALALVALAAAVGVAVFVLKRPV